MSNLFNLRNDLFTLFNKLKGYDAGYTTKSTNKIIIDSNGERFLITIDKIDNPAEEMHKDIDTYCSK